LNWKIQLSFAGSAGLGWGRFGGAKGRRAESRKLGRRVWAALLSSAARGARVTLSRGPLAPLAKFKSRCKMIGRLRGRPLAGRAPFAALCGSSRPSRCDQDDERRAAEAQLSEAEGEAKGRPEGDKADKLTAEIYPPPTNGKRFSRRLAGLSALVCGQCFAARVLQPEFRCKSFAASQRELCGPQNNVTLAAFPSRHSASP